MKLTFKQYYFRIRLCRGLYIGAIGGWIASVFQTIFFNQPAYYSIIWPGLLFGVYFYKLLFLDINTKYDSKIFNIEYCGGKE